MSHRDLSRWTSPEKIWRYLTSPRAYDDGQYKTLAFAPATEPGWCVWVANEDDTAWTMRVVGWLTVQAGNDEEAVSVVPATWTASTAS